MTKKEMFAIIPAAIDASLLPEGVSQEDIASFCQKQIDQLDRKSSGTRKPTAQRIQSDAYRSQILDILVTEDRPLRISEICERIPGLENASSQKMVMLIRPMMLDHKVKHTYIKKVAHYTAI